MLEDERKTSHDKNLEYEEDIRNLRTEIQNLNEDLTRCHVSATSLKDELKESKVFAQKQSDYVTKMKSEFAKKVNADMFKTKILLMI